MKILVSGASGLVGSALRREAEGAGHQVVALTRRAANASDLVWDPSSGNIPREKICEFDAVIHLAGEGIASGRWNAEKKRRIRESRVKGTALLSQALADCATKPQVFVSASAIGFYGDRGDELLNEESSAGSMFLSDVCQDWENATQAAEDAGIRVVHTRFGIILSKNGGALAQMLTPFKLGAGGIVGNGRQYWSWVTLDDVVKSLLFVLSTPTATKTVNVVSPHPVTNREFTEALGHVLHRPTVFPLPAFVARLMLGEMADELLLASARVLPENLQQAGFVFSYPELEPALRHVLGK